MTLLLTILSVLAAVSFLLVLSISLLLIFKTLQSVKVTLRKIAMGVRAIEQQTISLQDRGAVLHETLSTAGSRMHHAAERVSVADRALEREARTLAGIS